MAELGGPSQLLEAAWIVWVMVPLLHRHPQWWVGVPLTVLISPAPSPFIFFELLLLLPFY